MTNAPVGAINYESKSRKTSNYYINGRYHHGSIGVSRAVVAQPQSSHGLAHSRPYSRTAFAYANCRCPHPYPAPAETPVVPQAISTQTAVPTPTIIFTETAVSSTIPFTHTVQSGESLSTIAEQYQLTIADITAVNDLIDPNALTVDQILNIPTTNLAKPSTQPAIEPTQALTTTAVSTPFPLLLRPPNWPPSLTGDDVAANYPLTYDAPSGQITLHYQPNTYPDRHIRELGQTIDDIWADIQSQLGKPFPRRIDVYLAGTLFAINPALQGLTQSWNYRSFILVNGAFDPGEAHYILAHELTHIASTHLLGPAFFAHDPRRRGRPSAPSLSHRTSWLPATHRDLRRYCRHTGIQNGRAHEQV
ncbi:MAG: LysM peptidoglycan-binding domain-containing protein [Chloroflexi bacterium]|nr:LysM peptidoglycan-binding domain-containing protein [Chloroflexota bacterium]